MDLSMLPLQENGSIRKFSKQVDLSYISIWGAKPFLQPLEVEGTVEEHPNGEVLLTYQVKGTSVLPCARCLTNVERKFSPSFTHLLGENREDPFDTDDKDKENDYLQIDQGKIHLTAIVAEDLLFHLEDTVLCSEECKGLCPVCGGDRNKNPCDCKVEEFQDPRFDALRELLGKQP